jgi:type II secretory pathway component PulC
MDKGTSDERLLKLIEGGAAEHKRKQNIGISPKKSFSELMQTSKFNLSLKNIKEFKPNLAALNKGLVAFAVVVTVVLVYALFSGPSVSASNAAYFTPSDISAVAKTFSAKDSQSLMRKNITGQEIKRNVFLAPGVKASALQESISANVAEMTKDLKLVGIIWSANPEAMIEYGKDARTYTLKKGDSFNGDQFKIKEVSRNSAILEISVGGKSSEYILR